MFYAFIWLPLFLINKFVLNLKYRKFKADSTEFLKKNIKNVLY